MQTHIYYRPFLTTCASLKPQNLLKLSPEISTIIHRLCQCTKGLYLVEEPNILRLILK